MSNESTLLSHSEVAALIAPSLVVLELEGRMCAGFIASADGHVVTSLHLVSEEEHVRAVLSDGRSIDIKEIAAIDPQRNLVALRIPATDIRPLALGPEDLVHEGARVFAVRAAGASQTLLEMRARSILEMSDWLTLFGLSSALPEGASGGPIVNERGELVGVIAIVSMESRPVSVGLPLRYVKPLLRSEGRMPLSVLLSGSARAPIGRDVPEHPLVLLETSNPSSLKAVVAAIGEAISVGAPAYNRGDIERCYRVYEDTARRLIATRGDCPGVMRALEEGLDRAATLDDADSRAWAMRDTFDGLLDVIERWFEARPLTLMPSKKTYLN